ncbi:hypothetical protein GLOIN_2v1768552 [Rhizophagus clarus]|uniref:Uncharacterized protein n=1 Tax=Rhizophagus clarus TaxID=94130 RepID=A0A8H3LY59_9GLOM|nr:hypothetical protein GLOIN_2v1768552 [Rhizophagus clarus]
MDLVNNDELYNKYENLENNLVNDDEYENLDEIFYNENENFGGLSDIEKNSNNKSIFELDFNMLAKAKQFIQQNVSDENEKEDKDIMSDKESNFSDSESDEEHDEIVTQLKDKQELSPCVIIDVFENKIQRYNSTTNLRQLWQMVEYHPLVFSTESSKYAQYICMACYEEKGGHIYQRVGRGVREDPNCDNMSHHENDTKKALKAIGYWILDIAASEKSIWQNKLLIHLVLFINQLNQEKSDNTLDILTPSIDTEINVPSLFITFIILALIKFKYDLYKKLNPKNLTPKNFFEFGEALAHSTLLAKNKLKLYKKSLESPNSIEEYHTSFSSCLVQFYDGWKIWLPRTMASLCRKPKLLSSLQEILKIVNITSHTQRHECNLEKIRALLETTFGYGNIFDAIRGNSHVTLRMLFQYQLPELPEVLEIQEMIFEKLLAFNNENFTYQSNFDESDIRNEIMTYFKVGCNFSPPNIVILNAGNPPSNDSTVHECLKMYANEIGIENDGYINVVADEAIFRRGYDIFNMAGILGIQYLDKLEKSVDFRATSKVLELIWHESLKAFSPLFPISGKSNYARSVTHHLYCIENDSKLRAMLCVAPSVNLTSPGHFFAYDEALETFGVKFVKQNVTRIPTDSEDSKPRNVQSRKEKIWELVHLLVNAFKSTNPFENPIFEFCNNLNDEGINQLVAAYDISIRRLQAIVNQEILLTEDYTTVGKRARNITRVTVADISKMKKEKKIEVREEREKEKESKKGRERGRGKERGKGRGKGRGRRRRRGSE